MTTPTIPRDDPADDQADFAFDQDLAATTEPRPRHRRRLVAIPVVVVTAAAVALWVTNPFAATASTLVTAKATTGTIVSSVSISGTVAASTVDELTFGTSGTVSAVDVTPGEKVTTGEVLATIDATSLQAQIETATANLAAARARLALDQAGPTAASVASAKDSVSQAELQLSTARQSLSDTYLENDQSLAQARAAVSTAKATLASDIATLGSADPQIARDQQAVSSAETALSGAELKATLAVHQAQDQVSSASLGVTSAKDAYALKVVPATAAQLDADKAAVASAQQALDTLQANGATITSPIDGTVTAVNIVVGQQVAGSSTGGSSSTSTTTTTTTGQIEVMDLSKLQIAGEASETDIAKLKAGEAATITAAAIGSNTVVGSVCSVGVVGTQISGVTSFPVTVCLDGTNSGLLVGMSATAAVQTSRADDAVLVPSLAVRTVGGQQVVTVIGANGTTQTTVPVTVGITNGSQTQITGGLSSGATVVESLQSSTGTARTGGAVRGITGIGGGFGG